MTDISGDQNATNEDAPPPRGLWPAIGAIAIGYFAVVGVGMWFIHDIAEALAPIIGDDPLVQRLAGWSVWAVFLLPVAFVFLRAARHWARGTRTSTAGRWATTVALVLLSAPGFITFGGRGGPDEETQDALRVIGRDFALGVQLGRVGAVIVIFVFLGLVIARGKAISDKTSGTVAFLRTPAYAALGVLSVTLLGAIFLSPG